MRSKKKVWIAVFQVIEVFEKIEVSFKEDKTMEKENKNQVNKFENVNFKKF